MGRRMVYGLGVRSMGWGRGLRARVAVYVPTRSLWAGVAAYGPGARFMGRGRGLWAGRSVYFVKNIPGLKIKTANIYVCDQCL